MPARQRLPLLEQRQLELSTCAFCPKLCRASCPVSDARPSEAVTPWGKMTSAFDRARTGSVDAEQAELAWACSGCLGCREACDHRNPVVETLRDARADYVALGHAPKNVASLLARREQIEARLEAAVKALSAEPGVSLQAERTLLLGCRYATELPEVAKDAIAVATKLAGPLRLASGCCGAWQDAAGIPDAARATRGRLAVELALGNRPGGPGAPPRLLVLDPGCALALRDFSPVTLVELARADAQRFSAGSGAKQTLRYHDACSLGRGLGLYEQPRELLRVVLGEPALEFERNREAARCSGAGGLLPVSMPEVAGVAAQQRLAEHERLGGGTVVTGCASSLSMFRKQGTQALDLMTVLARGLTRNA